MPSAWSTCARSTSRRSRAVAKDAFDYYAFVRNAYLQNRQARVLDATDTSAAAEEDLYDFEEEEGEDDVDYDLDLDESGSTGEDDGGDDASAEANDEADGSVTGGESSDGEE